MQDLQMSLARTKNSSFSRVESGSEETPLSAGDSTLRARADALQSDLDTANAHLALERERVSNEYGDNNCLGCFLTISIFRLKYSYCTVV